jgi:hypothetical protein
MLKVSEYACFGRGSVSEEKGLKQSFWNRFISALIGVSAR